VTETLRRTERDVCGIVVTHEVVDDGRQDQMLDRISHRGSDGAGSRQVGETLLDHRRLAIVDVDGGTQPLIDDRGQVLVGNGEVYDHDELRAELGPERFTAASDNETALQAATVRARYRRGAISAITSSSMSRSPGVWCCSSTPVTPASASRPM
jgi:Glutamine amidotransferase domain